jgi:hypothetical protein
MARMGDWRDNKDIEIPLDGVGGVSIVVKADVHREGSFSAYHATRPSLTYPSQALTSPLTLSRTKPRQKVSPKWPGARAKKSTACLITSYGTETPTRNPAMLERHTNVESLLVVSQPFCTFCFRIDPHSVA